MAAARTRIRRVVPAGKSNQPSGTETRPPEAGAVSPSDVLGGTTSARACSVRRSRTAFMWPPFVTVAIQATQDARTIPGGTHRVRVPRKVSGAGYVAFARLVRELYIR